MKDRLIQREQPELYHSNMIGWLNHLRKEAIAKNIENIKTDNSNIQETGQIVIDKLN